MVEEKRRLVEGENKEITVARQGELLGLSRSFYYYSSTRDDGYNFELMREMDKEYTKAPFYGVRRLSASLRAHGYRVNPKRVRVLMQKMGLQAIYPRKRRTINGWGQVYDNIFVERLWQTVEYREIYLHEYQTVAEARESLRAYFQFYNTERLPQSLGYRTPHEVYFGSPARMKPVELSM